MKHPKLPHVVDGKLITNDLRPLGFRDIRILVIDHDKFTSKYTFSDELNWKAPKKCIAEFSRVAESTWNVIRDTKGRKIPDMTGEQVYSVYVVDFLNKKLRTFGITYAWLEIDIIDTLNENGWFEIPRTLLYLVTVKKANVYTITPLCDDSGIDGIGDAVKFNDVKKSTIHKGMRAKKRS